MLINITASCKLLNLYVLTKGTFFFVFFFLHFYKILMVGLLFLHVYYAEIFF